MFFRNYNYIIHQIKQKVNPYCSPRWYKANVWLIWWEYIPMSGCYHWRHVD